MRKKHLFHPREIAFCGYSGSGKTTLLVRLVKTLASRCAVGYVKHDVHGFSMDYPGKDTFRVRESGARAVFINDARHWAFQAFGICPPKVRRGLFADCDLVLVEGYKDSSLPKILLLDGKGQMLSALKEGRITQVRACIGPSAKTPSLAAAYPYFQRDRIPAISKFILAQFQIRRGRE
jgi:molybdopterin-guanine dinucleotide biosynthesis protein MobB